MSTESRDDQSTTLGRPLVTDLQLVSPSPLMDASHLCLWIIDHIGCLLGHVDCYFLISKSHGIGKCNTDDQMSRLIPQDSRILGIQDFRFGFPNPDLDHNRARRTWPAFNKASKAFDERPRSNMQTCVVPVVMT